MATYDSEKVILKNNKEVIIRNLQPRDAEKYSTFSEMIAIESAHTLHFKGQFISIDKMEEKWKISTDSPCQLELGGFNKEKLISHLTFYKPRPYHPYEKHIGEFGIKILKEYCFSGLGSKMLLIMENIAKKMDIKRIQATVRTLNYVGISFYQKHGYEIEGVKREAAFINGFYENEFYIAKILK
jgi:RimJ/RimL family protein N-acetyltransferase